MTTERRHQFRLFPRTKWTFWLLGKEVLPGGFDVVGSGCFRRLVVRLLAPWLHYSTNRARFLSPLALSIASSEGAPDLLRRPSSQSP